MLEIGSIVDGKYKILNVVGKGGMSVVYLAMNERANKQWAIKEVRKDGVQNFEVVKQNLIVETELLKRFNHPHLPSIIDVIDGDGTFLIVMDYIEGNPLSKALETSGAQNQEDVIEWAKQLCDVLGYLHSRKPPIIYRDMKPSNVMLKPDGNVMLIDFGTAREFKSNSVADTTCLGTQGYAAPEQFGGQGQTDARTDIYCLGATMYHLITGHNPCTPPYEMYPIRQWNPTLSSGLEEIIIKCTQRNPNDRYQSCAELLYALDHFRDLDIENKKVQSLKWKTFLTSMILTVVMLFATIGFSVAKSFETASTYDSYIARAENTQDPEEYIKAIDIEPTNIKAYTGLLDLYIDDANLSQDEYESILSVTDKYETIIRNNNPQRFADEFEYDLGKHLFFAYNDGKDKTRGINASVKWLTDVVANSADEKTRDRAEILTKIGGYYSKVSNIGKDGSEVARDVDGEEVINAESYWNDLVSIAEEDLAKAETADIALCVYKFVALEMLNHIDWFLEKEITEQEFESQLNKLEQYTLGVKDATSYSPERNDEDIEQVLYAIQQTRNISTGSNTGSNVSTNGMGGN